MKKSLILLIVLLGILSANANNIVISNMSLTGQNTASDYTLVQFDISWDNSWRTSTLESNWDAAWVFIKYRLTSSTVWRHAKLNTNGHTAPAGSTITSAADGTGVFMYKSANGIGSNNWASAQLSWNYGADGLPDNYAVEVCVYAIEMVYVPQGVFVLGSGGTEIGSFTDGSWSSGATVPFSVASENSITIDHSANNLWGISSAGSSTIGGTGSLPAAYPKGYAAFYCMKYEISQGQYVDFLNKLTRDQQDTRTETNVSNGTTSVTKRYVMTNTATLQDRNGIRCDATIHTSNPLTFYCDLNANGTGGEAADGQSLACNYLSWGDIAAYLDWSGLRPMSELEYEKACRGTQTAVANEYVWGTTGIAASAYTLSNAGANNEVIATNYSTTVGNASYTVTDGSINGPERVGIYAGTTGNTGRATSGATYYGIMEMSGNLWERVVTAGNATGRTYSNTQGDGILDATGDANATTWPVSDAIGGGFRGGNFSQAVAYLRVSDRIFAVLTGLTRELNYGGRGIRNAP